VAVNQSGQEAPAAIDDVVDFAQLATVFAELSIQDIGSTPYRVSA
jgi:hypothetical protein